MESSVLFNTLGYKATSLSDITRATGLTKGAIYRHFQDKAELEREALRFMLSDFIKDLRRRIKNAKSAHEKLNAVLDYFATYRVNPPFVGGCPLMNAAIESDDANPELKKETQLMMMTMHKSIATILSNGIKHGQLKPEISVRDMSSFFISAIEGAIMMMKLTDNGHHLQSVIKHLREEIARLSR